MTRFIHLDVNASHGVLPEVVGYLKGGEFHGFLNPSSVHQGGQQARAAVEEAREQVRALCGASDDYRVIFTSGATEANNTVVHSVYSSLGMNETARQPDQDGFRVVTSALEHPSILEPVRALACSECRVNAVPGTPAGTVEAEALLESCTAATRLVSLMAVNNETGVINPLQEIFKLARVRAPHALLHTDATQAIGKIPFSVFECGADALSVSGHKIGALPGVGALLIRKSLSISPLLRGGAQEQRFRSGTENVLGIVSFGIAARAVRESLRERLQAVAETRERFTQGLQSMHGVELNQFGGPTVSGTLSVRFQGLGADDLVVALDAAGIRASAGAACASGKPEPSHVLLAMGWSSEHARETVRFSFGAEMNSALVDEALGRIEKVVARMQMM